MTMTCRHAPRAEESRGKKQQLILAAKTTKKINITYVRIYEMYTAIYFEKGCPKNCARDTPER